MTSKTRNMFMALVGAYLTYTGVNLVRGALESEPKNAALFIAVGVFFAVFGVATIVVNIKSYLKESKPESQEDEGAAAETAEEPVLQGETKHQSEGPVFASVGGEEAADQEAADAQAGEPEDEDTDEEPKDAARESGDGEEEPESADENEAAESEDGERGVC